jgi:acyl-CoA thioester hydrolase
MTEKNNFFYSCDFEVRDSEIDIEGIVSNPNYLIYMQHARNKHIKALGIDFIEMHKEGYDFLLVHTDINFKDSLRSGDEFSVTSRLELSKIRVIFYQEVIRKKDNKVITTATNTVVCLETSTRKLVMPERLRITLKDN